VRYEANIDNITSASIPAPSSTDHDLTLFAQATESETTDVYANTHVHLCKKRSSDLGNNIIAAKTKFDLTARKFNNSIVIIDECS
jgi:hypothetical protein